MDDLPAPIWIISLPSAGEKTVALGGDLGRL